MKTRMVERGTERDSTLFLVDDRTLDLWLEHRIELRRCDPTSNFYAGFSAWSSGDGIMHRRGKMQNKDFRLDWWSDAEWTRYKKEFASTILNFWDNKFELRPNLAWFNRWSSGAPEKPTIKCRLSITPGATANAHWRFYIVKPKDKGFRSFVSHDHRVGVFTHRDLSRRSRTRKTWVGRNGRDPIWHDLTFSQHVILHEFGHVLGLDHIHGKGNAKKNYGLTLAQRNDVMGIGDNVTARAVSPWLDQLNRHLTFGPKDTGIKFWPIVLAPQVVSYWDNDDD